VYTDVEDVETIARKFDESFHEVVEKMLMILSRRCREDVDDVEKMSRRC